MFTAMSQLGRQQALQGRRSIEDCERWERQFWEMAFPIND